LRADDEPVRTQSPISDKSKPEPLLFFLSITVFSGRMAFHPSGNTVGARSAQVFVAASDGVENTL